LRIVKTYLGLEMIGVASQLRVKARQQLMTEREPALMMCKI